MNLPSTIGLRDVQTHAAQPKGQRRFILEHFENDDYILAIDHSTSSLFTECDRKYELSSVYGRTGHRTAALTYGSAIHKGLETYYKGELVLETIIQAAIEELNQFPPTTNEWRNAEKLRETLTSYIKKYQREDSFTLLKHDDIPLVECPFRTPLTTILVDSKLHYPASMLLTGQDQPLLNDDQMYVKNLHVLWTGVVDLVIEEEGRTYVVDHKTTSVEGDTYWKAFELSPQFRGYVWAAQQIIGRKIDGAMANVIYGREPAKSAEAQKKQREKEFMRRHFLYREDQIEEWRVNTIATMENLVHSLVTGMFSARFSQCVGKFGVCPYHDVCILPEKNRATMLATDQYADTIWNPLS